MKCCICGTNKNAREFKVIDGYKLLKCGKCGLVYLDAVLGEGEDKEFIGAARKELNADSAEKKVEFWSFPDLYEKHKRIFNGFFDQRLSRILKARSNACSILDAGCGYGFWMEYLFQKGFEVEGFDICRETVGYAESHFGLNVKCCSLEDFNTDKKYDVIVLCDIVEHLADPILGLQKCRSLLNDDGLIYIQLPNILGFKIPLNHGFGFPYHLWQFSTSTVKQLLDKIDLKFIKYWTGVQGVIGKYENGGPSAVDNILWWGARFLKIGNRLQVLAGKN